MKTRFSGEQRWQRMCLLLALLVFVYWAPMKQAHALTGAQIFTNECTACHTATPSGPNFNAANKQSLLIWLRDVAAMGIDAVSDSDLSLVASYINSQTTSPDPANGAVPFNAGGASATDFTLAYVYLNSARGGITSVVTVTPPTKGIVTYSTVGNEAHALYTPNVGETGTDTWTYKGTGPGGDTSIRTATVSIASPSTPVVTNTNVTITAGSAYSGNITATGLAIDAYGGSGLPPNLTINSGTGAITGTPITPGVYNATLTAHNAGGTGSKVVTFTVSATASVCSLTASAGQTLAPSNSAFYDCLFPGLTAPASVAYAIASPPTHGTAGIAGKAFTYTPATGFFGTDTLTVTTFVTGLSNVTSTVNITVSERPNPTKDATVASLVQSQNDAALRFAGAQLANYNRHLDSLHGVRSNTTTPSTARWRSPIASPSLAQQYKTTTGGLDATALPAGNAPASLPTSAVLPAVAEGLGLQGSATYQLATGLIQNRSVDLGLLSRSLGGTAQTQMEQQPNTHIWAEGVASFGARDASGGVSGSDFSSSGVSMGVDYVVNKKLTLGMGLGFAQDTTKVGTDGTQNKAQGYSLAVYGSYQPGNQMYVDALLGVGSLDFDLQRYVSATSEFARSNRKGYQIFGSLGTGYEFRNAGTLMSPYARLDFSSSRLNEAAETGAGSYALTYFDQTNNLAQGVLGLRGEAVHSTPFGWAVPRARVEARQDLSGSGEATLAYTDQVTGGPRYSIAQNSTLRSAVVLGIGSDFVLRDGWTWGLDYQLTQVSAQESSYALRLRVIKELGRRGLPNLLQGVEEDFNDDSELQVEASSLWDDNITRAKAGADVRSDTVYSVGLTKSHAISLTGTTRLLLNGSVGGERFQSYNGLSNLNAMAEATYQYRESSDFDAPTYSAFGRVTALRHQASLRDGYRYSVGVSRTQAITDRITLFGALSYNGRNATSDVFRTQDTSVRLNLDYALRSGGTLYATGEYRDGDIVSTGRASLENVTIAKVFVQDDAYAGGQFFSYRFAGSTWLTTLGYNLGLGPRDSLDFAWRRVESTPGLRPAWATSPNSYITNQLSASYLMRF
jgi:outer membrane autotransporter protein